MREADWNDTIDSIVERVMNKLAREMPKDEPVGGALALVTSYVPSPRTAWDTLVKRYGEDVECILHGDAEFAPLGMNILREGEDISRKEVLQKAAEKGCVVLMTPRLSLLENIASGNDGGFVEYVVLRALLWGRRVGVVLDFSLPQFKRNTFFERIIDTVDSLTSMGVEVAQYNCAGEAEIKKLTLVTQTEIEDAAKRGEKTLFCEVGAIITPLAREKARDLGIGID